MYYEINVSRNGAHLFATHERSLLTEEQAWSLFRELASKFPREQGHVVSMSRWSTHGEPLVSTQGEYDD